MEKKLLLPHRFQKFGWAILIPGLILGATYLIGDWNYPQWLSPTTLQEQILNNIVLLFCTIGGVMVACSQETIEDEMISCLRLNSLLIAFYVNYGLLIIAALAVYDIDFLHVMLYNLFTMLLIFMVIFRYKLWHHKNQTCDEESN